MLIWDEVVNDLFCTSSDTDQALLGMLNSLDIELQFVKVPI